ncbi:DUF4320 family protein [Paenibacillus anaericanus]|uniref:DUF4320 family protein n=1 Tax=Paenibacillus anaericanus TaxID=170367 RepID=A0A433XVV3_9BACL|nr:DUF4320 family protein [Paenibacillus anaericanus]RUT38686.1 DUF4320 family protein [Paenibacillus anaericanus]
MVIDRIKNRFKKVLNQRGDINAIGVLFVIFIIVIFIFGSIDIEGYMSTHKKLSQAADETIEIMKAEGGFDTSTREFFLDYCRKKGLDVSSITIEATPKLVQRGSDLEIRASTTYILKAFKPLGLGELIWPVHIKVEGLSRTYFREG